jgi:hypothetical protein
MGREMRREKSNGDIGVRHIEKLTERHYNAIDILRLRQIISDPYPLCGPSRIRFDVTVCKRAPGPCGRVVYGTRPGAGKRARTLCSQLWPLESKPV